MSDIGQPFERFGVPASHQGRPFPTRVRKLCSRKVLQESTVPDRPQTPLRVPGVGDLTCGNYTSYTRMFRIGFEKESTHKPFFASRASVSNPSSTVSPGTYFRYCQHPLCLMLRVLFGSPCRANPGTGVRLFCYPERPQSTRSCLAGSSGRYLGS